MIKVPPSEIATRIVSFQHFLLERGVDAAIIRQNADLYYFTGTVQDGYLFVPSVGEPLFCVRRQIERAMEQSPLRPIIPIRTPREIPNILL
ncbi:MAG TPA: aminopeptidase P family protein, partial [Deltaproteobacteria bacterium]|nr:aminopeptidase P family protein [Deltaproteobacteria bacterium]